MSTPGPAHVASGEAVRRHLVGIDGLDRLREVVSGAELEYHQLAPGRLKTRLLRAVAGPVTFDCCRHSLPLRAMGCAGPDLASFVLVLTPAVFNGMSVKAGDLILYPPGSEFEGFSKGRFGDYIFTVRPEDVARFAMEAGFGEEVARLGRGARVLCGVKESRRLVAYGLVLEGRAADLSGSPAAISAGVLRCLCEILASRRGARSEATRLHRQSSLVAVAERFLLQERDEEITLSSICRALDVSTRTLQTAFRSVAGVGPCEYGRIRRLNAARRELLRRKPAAHVSDVALRHGFSHFGRFSAYYRELFDETPSETLRRSAADATALTVASP